MTAGFTKTPMHRYVLRDLLRNPRRTIASVGGIVLGVALFSGVLFFVDASAATMTRRAIAPLTLDMQRVLSSPLGRRISLQERIGGSAPLRAGEAATVTLTVANDSLEPANEVVVNDEPPPPLAYVAGSTRRDGQVVADVGGQSPLAQGLARTGLNIGTVAPGATVVLSYEARPMADVAVPEALPLRGTVSSREEVLPSAANSPPPLPLGQLVGRIAKVPGVAAADGLSFVDLPAGSLRRDGRSLPNPVRVFGFDRRYAAHHPSIRMASGSFTAGAALLSAEAARALEVLPGRRVELQPPGDGAPLALGVSGVVDLGRATPLFSSRKSSRLEDFVYVPNSVVVGPETFEEVIIPAFRSANATRGGIISSEPVLEVDVVVDRSRLHPDPGSALAQTKAIAATIERIAPGQDNLIDNISNALQVARQDAAVGKRMFVFLGLPALLLAAALAVYSANIYAGAQRREQATLRLHGAPRRVLRRVVAEKAVALSFAGAVVGTALGYASALAVLGGSVLSDAAPSDLVVSGLVATGAGMVVTGLALYIPARRSWASDVARERREIAVRAQPVWRRWGLDVGLVVAGVVADGVAFAAGAFDGPVTSVSAGEAVSLPSPLLLAPMTAWLGATLLAMRLFEAVAARLPLPAAPRFGPSVRGTLVRSLRRRPRELAYGIGAVTLVVAFGMSLAIFAATYDAAKAEDARFAVGSDLRVTPSPLNPTPQPPAFASRLRVGGVRAATPVVYKLDNAVLIGPYDQDRKDLAAIDVAGFVRVAPLSDSFFGGRPATTALRRLGADPRGLLVDTDSAEDLSVDTGDRVEVLLARGTEQQRLETMHVVGMFERFPGFPQGVHLVANLAFYRQATALPGVDFFLGSTTEHHRRGLERAVGALRSGPGAVERIDIDTTETALNKDQSSLTALNVKGLVHLDTLHTLLMSVAVVAIFVFGRMLQRRREYVILRAQGMQARQVRALVLAEAALVAIAGVAAGMIIGCGMAYLLKHVLRPLFIVDPGLTVPVLGIAGLAAVVMTATLVSAFTATAVLSRLRPSELLREG